MRKRQKNAKHYLVFTQHPQEMSKTNHHVHSIYIDTSTGHVSTPCAYISSTTGFVPRSSIASSVSSSISMESNGLMSYPGKMLQSLNRIQVSTGVRASLGSSNLGVPWPRELALLQQDPTRAQKSKVRRRRCIDHGLLEA